MKTIFSTLTLLAFAINGLADVTSAPQLAPEDIGAYKWIISETGGDGEVVILRHIRTKTSGGDSQKETRDTVANAPGEKQEGTFVAINPTYFDPDHDGEPNWHIAAFGGSAWCLGEVAESETSDNYGKIRFEKEDGSSTEFEFMAIVMPYAEAKELYPDLPEATRNWKWSGSPKSEE